MNYIQLVVYYCTSYRTIDKSSSSARGVTDTRATCPSLALPPPPPGRQPRAEENSVDETSYRRLSVPRGEIRDLRRSRHDLRLPLHDLPTAVRQRLRHGRRFRRRRPGDDGDRSRAFHPPRTRQKVPLLFLPAMRSPDLPPVVHGSRRLPVSQHQTGNARRHELAAAGMSRLDAACAALGPLLGR